MEQAILIQFLQWYFESASGITDVVDERIYCQIPATDKIFPKITYISFGGLKRGNANGFYGETFYFGIFIDVPEDDLSKESFISFTEDLNTLFEDQDVTYLTHTVEIKRMNSIAPTSKYIDEMETHVTRLGFQIQLKIKQT